MKGGNINIWKSGLARPRWTRTPEHVRQAKYPLTNSYLAGQSTENCGRAGRCTDTRPFIGGKTQTLWSTLKELTQDSTDCYYIHTHTHTNFACSETSTSIYDSQTAEIH